jgi:acyl carrier protein
MEDVASRLTRCFELVFPDLSAPQIQELDQANLPAWDSIASITLLNVIEEEFQIEIDMELLADLDSFDRIRAHVTPLVNVG